MIKTTPTPLPPGTPQLIVPPEYSLWASTDYYIQYWNAIIPLTMRTVIQAILLISIIIIGVYLFTRFMKSSTQKDSEE